MVIRPRIRAFLAALGLYVLAALFIGYFGVNAYTGNRGILAKQNLDQRIADLKTNSTPPRPSAGVGSAASRS
jgi:cell division protein FtsB